MKKVAFITIHIGINVGSNLQAIATSEVLKRVGYNPILINYIPPRVTFRRYWKNAKTNLVTLIKRILGFPLNYYVIKKFEKYLAKYCKLTKPIYYNDSFADVIPQADIYLTGSDQVWNFHHNEGYDYHYFFDGINGKKVSYASSIGMSSLSKDEEELIKTKLHNYSKLSVREENAVHILDNLGLQSIQHIDPTLMLSCSQWIPYMSKKRYKRSYVLVYHPYNISDIKAIYDVARKIAKEKNLDVVTFTWEHSSFRMADKTYYYASPGDFLSLMYHADYVVTNSFHGTAFSVNLNKQFWVFAPSHFSSRITSLIKLLGIENRMIERKDYCIDFNIDDNIDYTKVNEILENERTRAFDYLKEL